MHLHVRVITGSLRAVGAVLRTAAGFYRKQRASLDFLRIMKFTVNCGPRINQIQDRLMIYLADFCPCSVVAYDCHVAD